MNNSLKTLRSELKLNSTQLKGNGNSVQLLKDRQGILKSELAASREKVVLLNSKLSEAKKIFGDNSKEVQTLNRELADAKNVQAAIQNDLSVTNAKLQEQAKANSELEQSVSAADSKLSELDKELELNSTKLQGTTDKTGLLKEKQNLLSNQSQISAEKVKTLEQALEECGKEVGENSEEYAELKSRLLDAKTQQAAIQNEIRNTTKELDNQKTAVQKVGEGLKTFGNGMTSAGQATRELSAGAVAGLGGAGAAAISFESAFAGVQKTVDEVYDANGKCTYSYKQLEDGIRGMAKEIPSSVTEISSVAEAAGQLGIKTEDILGFTRVMIDMGESTNLSSDVAATSIAKFANITGLAADTSMPAEEKYGKLGSTIVALGNSYATTEADIMAMAQNLASAGTQIGMSESDILAMAASLSSVGLEAQAGGTSFSKAMIAMQLAVETNSKSLSKWASVAGMSSSEFSKAFKEDATGAMQAFIQGLSKCGGESKSAIKILDDMGIKETRMRDALLRSANASDIFTSAVKLGKNAWEENTALTEEAEKRYQTTASQLSIMKNHIVDAGISLGSTFLPIINQGITKVGEFADKLSGTNPATLKMIAGLLAVVAVISPLLSGIGKVSIGISSMIEMGGKIKGVFAGVGVVGESAGGAAAAGMALPLIPILAVIAGITGVIAVFAILWNKSESFKNFFSGMWNGFINVINGFLEKINFGDKIEGIKNQFSGLAEKILGLENIFKAVGTIGTSLIVPVLALIAGGFNALLSVISSGITIIGGIIDVFSGLGDIIVGIFTDDMELAKQGAETFKQGIMSVFSGLVNVIPGILNGLVEGITSFFSSLIESSGVGDFVQGIIEKFQGIGEKISSVFATIGNIVTVGIMMVGSIFSAATQIIALPFTFIWENCKGIVLEKWNQIKTTISGKVQEIKGIVSTGFGIVKTYIINPVTQAYDSAKTKFEGIKSVISTKVNQVKTSVKSGFSTVKTNIITPITSAYSSVVSKFEGIRKTITEKINAAKTAVKNAIDKMKGFFKFSWSLPKLKMPHFNVSGKFSLNPPSVPKFNITWRKLGAIFKSPTIFQSRLGMQGVGEAGAEAVLPISNLRDYVREEMENVVTRIQISRQEIDYDKLAGAMSEQKIIVKYKEREVGRMIRREANA